MSTRPTPDEFSELFVPVRALPGETRKRLSPYLWRTVARKDVAEYEADGWAAEKWLSRSVRMRKPKSHDVAFRDRVWATLALLNFELMNRGDGFRIPVVVGNETPEISVFAGDDEVALTVACHSSETLRHTQLRREIQSLLEHRAEVVRALKRCLPGRKPRFVIVTNNLAVPLSAQKNIAEHDVVYLDEEAIEYFATLADHLGRAARFQVLGSLFAGKKIPALDPRVHAIRGRMGGLTYYSFAIEPERLLKLAYILHRNEANNDLMPTYQRLIKKSRLQAVSRFVNNGGFFPNSIIINLDTGSRPPRFDAVSRAADGPVFGTLHLPQTYRAAYVIDGQHRLYGYANSERASSELVPVVAFVNLPRADQVRLFMQINENQQAVPKNLRNTLNADLLWDSGDLREQVRALRLRVAQYLGESKTSPLYGRVILGENPRSSHRCLTIDAISNGLLRGRFIGSFYKAHAKEVGTFYSGTNDATFEALVPFLELCLTHLRERLAAQWELGAAEGGFVVINTGIESLIRVFSDVVDHLIETKVVDPRSVQSDRLFEMCLPYIEALVIHLSSISGEQASEYRRMYGSGGGTRYWRKLQVAIRERIPEFSPPGLDGFLEDEARTFNTESYEMIRALEVFLNADVRRRLEGKFGVARWFHDGVPRKVRENTTKLAAEKNLDLEPERHVGPWECLHLSEYYAIVTQNLQIWNEIFADAYTRPDDRSRSGSWRSRASWMMELNRIRNENAHTYVVKPDEYEYLTGLHGWLIRGEPDG